MEQLELVLQLRDSTLVEAKIISIPFFKSQSSVINFVPYQSSLDGWVSTGPCILNYVLTLGVPRPNFQEPKRTRSWLMVQGKVELNG